MQKQSETEVKNSELSVKLSMLEREKEAEPDVEEKVSSHTSLKSSFPVFNSIFQCTFSN